MPPSRYPVLLRPSELRRFLCRRNTLFLHSYQVLFLLELSSQPILFIWNDDYRQFLIFSKLTVIANLRRLALDRYYGKWISISSKTRTWERSICNSFVSTLTTTSETAPNSKCPLIIIIVYYQPMRKNFKRRKMSVCKLKEKANHFKINL